MISSASRTKSAQSRSPSTAPKYFAVVEKDQSRPAFEAVSYGELSGVGRSDHGFVFDKAAALCQFRCNHKSASMVSFMRLGSSIKTTIPASAETAGRCPCRSFQKTMFVDHSQKQRVAVEVNLRGSAHQFHQCFSFFYRVGLGGAEAVCRYWPQCQQMHLRHRVSGRSWRFQCIERCIDLTSPFFCNFFVPIPFPSQNPFADLDVAEHQDVKVFGLAAAEQTALPG